MGIFKSALNTLVDIYKVSSTGSISDDISSSGALRPLGEQQNPYSSVAIDVPGRIEGVPSLRTFTSESGMVETGSGEVTHLLFMKPLPAGRKLAVGYIVVDQTTGDAYMIKETDKSPGGAIGHHWEIGLASTEVIS